ncbi:hypothetical protein M3Y96_00314200 [Aphelenchoides besseyi]|nr:hypothetical protein M3Y96_00314200 [Aphelenchoides besseyi]
MHPLVACIIGFSFTFLVGLLVLISIGIYLWATKYEKRRKEKVEQNAKLPLLLDDPPAKTKEVVRKPKQGTQMKSCGSDAFVNPTGKGTTSSPGTPLNDTVRHAVIVTN